MQSFLGIFLLFAVAFALSENRVGISWPKVARLFFSQSFLMLIFLKISWIKTGFFFLSQGIGHIRQSVSKGTEFVFGYIGGAPAPFIPASGSGTPFIFMFQALPMIVVIGALSMLLFHWGVLSFIIQKLSYGAQRTWKIGGALATAMAAKLFWGQTDAPLVVKPYLDTFSRNELFSLMVAGMATTSSALFVLYAGLLEQSLPGTEAIGHIIIATVINIPAALIMAEIMIPEDMPSTHGKLTAPYTCVNSMDAIARGTQDGWHVMWSIAAMVIVALAFVDLANKIFTSFASFLFANPVSLQKMLGILLGPVVWLMGIPMGEALSAGALLAQKIVFNEVVAFVHIAPEVQQGLSPRSVAILTYSLCGFGNLSSLAIQTGGLGQMIPSRKSEIALLSGRALLASLIACALSSALVSLML